jgi:hypothetical protein
MVPVLLDVVQTGNKPMPDTVTVHSEFAELIYGNQVGNEIKVPPMHTCLYASLLPMVNGSPTKCRMWVTASDNENDNLSEISTLRIAGSLAVITIVGTSKATPSTFKAGNAVLQAPAIPADGEETYSVRARIADVNGNPLANVPCIVRLNTPEITTISHEEAGAASDENGIVSFAAPPSKHPGLGIIEFMPQTGGSAHAVFQYVDPKDMGKIGLTSHTTIPNSTTLPPTTK